MALSIGITKKKRQGVGTSTAPFGAQGRQEWLWDNMPGSRPGWRTPTGAAPKRREISHIRRPTHSQERMRKKKSACSVRNDGVGGGRREGVGSVRSK